MPSYRQTKKTTWNTVILSGQLSWSEVQDLIRHSYDTCNRWQGSKNLAGSGFPDGRRFGLGERFEVAASVKC